MPRNTLDTVRERMERDLEEIQIHSERSSGAVHELSGAVLREFAKRLAERLRQVAQQGEGGSTAGSMCNTSRTSRHSEE